MLSFHVIFIIISVIPLTNTILDDDILYDIKWQPELTPSTNLGKNHLFISKRQEKYSCVLPTPQTTVTTTADTILLSEIQPFLDELHAKKPCLYRIDPYWTYELCHGIHLRQYHETTIAGKKSIDQDYFLGYYHPDEQDIMTNNDNQQFVKIHYKTVNHQEIPMLAFRYTEGTKCDINSNKPRETIVYYVCSEKGHDGIINFQEVSSCSYEITVTSSKICNIPAFSWVELNRHTINCYPRENALQKPRNLKKIENERDSLSKKSTGAQFTVTNADGTTFIISYDFAGEPESAPNPPANEQKPAGPTFDLSDQEFFEKFLSGTECLIDGTGWWRYELCYGKHVIQFHEDGNKRTDILLGKWDQDKHIQWLNSNPKKRSGGNTKDRQYVPLYYSDGDLCGATKSPRNVEVKLRCSKRTDRSRIPTMYLVEPDTCSYVLGVESPIFCNLNDYLDENSIPDQDKLIKRVNEP